MHFGTFQMTTEGIDEPLRALDDARPGDPGAPAPHRPGSDEPLA